MALKEELGLKRGYAEPAHEGLLNIYYTASMMKKRADAFFAEYGLTDVQFNLLSLLHRESPGEPGEEGLSQAQISDMMLVNRANITSLVDRMEKAGLVRRTAHRSDRRYNIIKLAAKGRKLFEEVEPIYIQKVRDVMGSLNARELKEMTSALGKIRCRLR
ncbi:MAG: MarR family transcriptional regulator [Planctomycetes bacterium]|nr:MarR family transcriptional regulator [Planctomycetota bacterium]